MLCLLIVSSCKDNNQKLPQIDGFDNSDQVASDHLLAHWTFDGTLNEAISGTAPTTSVGNSFTDGIKGQALDLSQGYVLYPTIDNLSGENAIPSVTVSAWINIDNNGSTASSIFALTQSTSTQSDWNTGPINMYAETGHPVATDDTLALHAAFSTYIDGTRYGGDNINDYGVRGTDFQTVLGTNQWVHYVMRYDGNESNIDIYADGVRVSNDKFRHRTYNPGSGDVGIGPIAINSATQVLLGGWPNADAGFSNSAAQTWQGMLTGKIDEVRVYNEALSDSDIGALYDLEKAGR